MASDGLPPLPGRAPAAAASGQLSGLISRTDAVVARLRAASERENELAERVAHLASRLAEVVEKHASADKRLDELLEVDTQRSEDVKRRHEDLSREFSEFKAWNVLDSKSWIASVVGKVAIFVGSALSFLFFLPFTALYSKTLRFFRNRRRRGSPAARRPPWATGSGEIGTDFSGVLDEINANSWATGFGATDSASDSLSFGSVGSPTGKTDSPVGVLVDADDKLAGNGGTRSTKPEKGPRQRKGLRPGKAESKLEASGRRTGTGAEQSSASTRQPADASADGGQLIASDDESKADGKQKGASKGRKKKMKRKPSWTLDVNQEEGFEIGPDTSGDFWGAFGTPGASSSSPKRKR